MTDGERGTPDPGREPEATSGLVKDRAVSGAVRVRMAAARSVTPTRLGTIILIALLLGAAAYVARSPVVTGEAPSSADPGATQGATPGPAPDASIPVATLPPAESTEPSATAEPVATGPPPTDGAPQATPALAPTQNGDVVATIPAGDADDIGAPTCLATPCQLLVEVEVISQCLADADTALVTFRVHWDADLPIDRTKGDIGNGYVEAHSENELGMDGRLDLIGSYDRTVNVRVRRDLWIVLRFFREDYDLSVPDEEHRGFWLADAVGGATFDPPNVCP